MLTSTESSLINTDQPCTTQVISLSRKRWNDRCGMSERIEQIDQLMSEYVTISPNDARTVRHPETLNAKGY